MPIDPSDHKTFINAISEEIFCFRSLCMQHAAQWKKDPSSWLGWYLFWPIISMIPNPLAHMFQRKCIYNFRMKFSVSDHCVCGALPNGKRTPQRDQRDICFGHLCLVQCSKFELENEEKFHSSASLPFFFVRLQCACALANSLSFHIWAWFKPLSQFFCFKIMSIALFSSKIRTYRRGNDHRIKNHG